MIQGVGLRKQVVRVALYLGFWTLLGVFDATRSYFIHQSVGRPFQWWFAITVGLSDWYMWAALAPVVVHLTRQHPMGGRRWPYNLAVHLVVCLLLSFLIIAFLSALYYVLSPFRELHLERGLGDWFQLIYLEFLVFYLWVYFAIVGASQALNYYRQYRERELHAAKLEAQLAQTQLQMLKMQLHPHFLFNTLNAISALIHRDVELADQMIARLGELLRMTLQSAGTHEVSFRRELEFIQAYLEIEKARLGPRLTVHMQCDPEDYDAAVPNLAWQPIVENAIRHGIAPRPQGGRLWMKAQRKGNRVCLEVSDDGPGLPAGPPAVLGKGIGLSNTRARLEQLYGADHRLEFTQRPGGGLCVSLTIPFRLAVGIEGDANPDLDEVSVSSDATTTAPGIAHIGAEKS